MEEKGLKHYAFCFLDKENGTMSERMLTTDQG